MRIKRERRKGEEISFELSMEDMGKTTILGGGGVVMVPSVQELLAKQPGDTVPARYVRPHQDPPPLVNGTAALPQPPAVSLQGLLSADDLLEASELEKLHHACRDWGFFQLMDHGVSSSVIEKMKRELQKFFQLPVEEKNKFGQRAGDTEGLGRAFVASDEQKLDWVDRFAIVTHPTSIRKPHLLPMLPPPFRDAMEAYSEEMQHLGTKLFKLMAKALKMNPKDMNLFEDARQAIRMNYYPPCPQPHKVIGLSPHSDASAITILLQASEVEGLQIKHDEAWLPIKPLPGAFIVNVGDVVEIVSNGIYRSIEHRAVVNSDKERLSIATFITPREEVEMGPAPSLVTPQTPAVFRKAAYGEFLTAYFSGELQGKSHVDVMRIQGAKGLDK